MELLLDLPPVPIPGPRALPVLGKYANVLRFFADPVGAMLAMERRYGDVVALIEGNASVLCAFGAEHNRRILPNAAAFHNMTELLFPLPEGSSMRRISANMMFMNGEDHRRLRRMMAPAFQKASIERHRDDIVAVAERALRRLTPGRAVDAFAEVNELMLRVAMRCLFGLDVTDDEGSLGRIALELLHGLTSAAVMALPVDVPGTPYARLLRVAERVEAKIRDLIEERRRLGGGHDVLSLLINAHDDDGSKFTDAELVAQSTLLFLAGHETTAQTLSWTLFLLSQHPRALADLEDEAHGVLRGGAPTAEQIAEMPLLDAVVKESMRVLPAAPFLALRTAQSTVDLGRFTLPAGARVILSPLVTHRSPDLYPEPRRFSPERWSRLNPTPFEFMPFGAGPRMCLGAGFANFAARVILPMIVQRVRLWLEPGARVSRAIHGITMGPKHGLPMRVAARGTPRPWSLWRAVRGDVHDLVDLP